VAIVLPKLSRRRSSTRWAADSAPALSLSLCQADGRYRMGQPLSAFWRIGKISPEVVFEGLEASVMWYTEGKGDEDLNVHHFQRWSDSQLGALDLDQSHALECVLPLTPLSYEGTLVRIRWCVRVRLFCSVGRDSVAQVPFQLTSDALLSSPASRSAGLLAGIENRLNQVGLAGLGSASAGGL
jgi:hypothetical protein